MIAGEPTIGATFRATKTPRATVVVPAYNAEKTIAETLRALENQSVPASDFEVIVVDDGSSDATAEIVRGFSRVKLIQQKNGGPAKARNAGARIARGDIVVFTDADCVPEPEWLVQMLKPFEDLTITGVQGAYRTRQTEWVARFVQLEIEERYERQARAMEKRGRIDFVGSYAAAYRRNEYLEVGGFDPTFPSASGEDPDLSFRLSERGARLVFNPRAVVFHTHPTRLLAYWRTKFFRAYWRVKLYGKNPSKMAGDNYTPKVLNAQIALAGLSVGAGFVSKAGFFLGGWPCDSAFFWVALGALGGIVLLSLPMVFFVARGNAGLGVLSVGVFLVNAYCFLGGVLKGAWDRFVRGVNT